MREREQCGWATATVAAAPLAAMPATYEPDRGPLFGLCEEDGNGGREGGDGDIRWSAVLVGHRGEARPGGLEKRESNRRSTTMPIPETLVKSRPNQFI